MKNRNNCCHRLFCRESDRFIAQYILNSNNRILRWIIRHFNSAALNTMRCNNGHSIFERVSHNCIMTRIYNMSSSLLSHHRDLPNCLHTHFQFVVHEHMIEQVCVIIERFQVGFRDVQPLLDLRFGVAAARAQTME